MPLKICLLIQGLKFSSNDYLWLFFFNSHFPICSYTQQVQLVSYNYWKQIKPPLETAVYYVKQVAKHKGAPHMRCIAADMPFYVYYNIDCWAFLVACCILTIFIITKLFWKLLQKLKPAMKYKLP